MMVIIIITSRSGVEVSRNVRQHQRLHQITDLFRWRFLLLRWRRRWRRSDIYEHRVEDLASPLRRCEATRAQAFWVGVCTNQPIDHWLLSADGGIMQRRRTIGRSIRHGHASSNQYMQGFTRGRKLLKYSQLKSQSGLGLPH